MQADRQIPSSSITDDLRFPPYSFSFSFTRSAVDDRREGLSAYRPIGRWRIAESESLKEKGVLRKVILGSNAFP